MKKQPKKKNERGLVNELIAAIKKNTPDPVYVFVDRDSGQQRHTRSGWDFALVWQGKTVFIEAKMQKSAQTPFQKLTQRQIENAGGRYRVLRFWPPGPTRREWVAVYSVFITDINHAAAPFFFHDDPGAADALDA